MTNNELIKRAEDAIERHSGVLLCIMEYGSHLYGLNTESSDRDYFGVFIAGEEYYTGLRTKNQIKLDVVSKGEDGRNDKDAIDFTIMELKTYVSKVEGCAPNLIATIFAEESKFIYKNPIIDDLFEFLRNNALCSDGVERGYYNYANNQRKKIFNKIDNYKLLKESYDCISDMKFSGDELLIDFIENNEDLRKYFTVHETHISCCKKLSNNKNSIVNFQNNMNVIQCIEGLKEQLAKYGPRTVASVNQDFDSKFAMHHFRLLFEGIDIFTTGRLTFPSSKKSFLLDIKANKISKYELSDISDRAFDEFKKSYELSVIVDTPDRYDIINKYLVSFIKSVRDCT
jgi:predicted nucleotidyltransferase